VVGDGRYVVGQSSSSSSRKDQSVMMLSSSVEWYPESGKESLAGVVVVSSFASLVIVGFDVVINGIVALLLLSVVDFGVVVVSKVCFASVLGVVSLVVVAQRAGESLPEETIAGR